jgi:hypothetical protein
MHKHRLGQKLVLPWVNECTSKNRAEWGDVDFSKGQSSYTEAQCLGIAGRLLDALGPDCVATRLEVILVSFQVTCDEQGNVRAASEPRYGCPIPVG